MLNVIVAEASRADEQECCGLLLGDAGGDSIATIRPAANVAPDPRRHFEIDPALLLAAHRAARSGGEAVIGYYHSHPTGDPFPSREDALQADPDGRYWLICTPAGAARLWRAVPQGAVHGRFDPVEMIVMPQR